MHLGLCPSALPAARPGSIIPLQVALNYLDHCHEVVHQFESRHVGPDRHRRDAAFPWPNGRGKAQQADPLAFMQGPYVAPSSWHSFVPFVRSAQ
jgi:hypothetical protein